MSLRDLFILIPSHSLEDFPTDLADEPAASLLNAFAVAWHPALIAAAESLPRWYRADMAPQATANQLFFIPAPSHDWLPGGWEDEAREHGATIVSHLHERDELARAALEFLPPESIPANLDADLVADFYALGSCVLQMELLSRQMRQFGDLDTTLLQTRAVAAAQAALVHDRETCVTHLRACFENLLETRERFYPVGCFLLDLCLLIPDQADSHFAAALAAGKPLSVLVSGEDLTTIGSQQPELLQQLAEACRTGTVSLLGGEQQETPLPLMPLESVLYQFQAGRATFERLTGGVARTWGRRRFGLATLVPQILEKYGYLGALHYVLDDGLYPDEEHSRLSWQGCDGTAIEALSRIPLAADSAASYTRFANRMGEAMDHDQVAGVVFARWPEVKTPWFEDFRRIHHYAPVLGEFVTFDRYFQPGPGPARNQAFKQKDYLTPFLIQAVARREKNPISRFGTHAHRRRVFDSLNWCRAAARAMYLEPIADADSEAVERTIEAAGPDAFSNTSLTTTTTSMPEAVQHAELALQRIGGEWPKSLADILLSGAPTVSNGSGGFLVLNPLSFSRRMVVPLPDLKSPPQPGGPIHAVQFNADTPDQPLSKAVIVDLPPCGFAWIPADGRGPMPVATKSAATVNEEGAILQNDLLEVSINTITGGIAEISKLGRRGNRLSQQLSYRFPRERSLPVANDPAVTVKSQYATMRGTGIDVRSNGPTFSEIETRGEIFDLAKPEVIGKFRQRVRLWIGRPVVEVELELSELKVVDGDPWNNAFVSRFAWEDSGAAVTRSVLDGAHGFMGERFESSDYIEIASGDDRTTLIPHGLPFHRRSGPRMVDTLLVVAGEERRSFQFTIAIDNPYPLQAARTATTPPIVVPTSSGPPRSGSSGWLFHVDAKNVQLTRLLDPINALLFENEEARSARGSGFAVRLVETEGRGRQVRLRCFRSPISARKRDFNGGTLADLACEGDTVLVALNGYEFADVELRFS